MSLMFTDKYEVGSLICCSLDRNKAIIDIKTSYKYRYCSDIVYK